MIQTAYLHLIGLQDATCEQHLQRLGSSLAGIQQLVTGHLALQGEELNEHLLLLGSTAKDV